MLNQIEFVSIAKIYFMKSSFYFIVVQVVLCSVLIVPTSCKKKVILPDSKVTFKIDGEYVEYISQEEVYFFFGGLAIQTVGKEKPTEILFIKAPNLTIKLSDPVVVGTGFYVGKSYQNGKLRESFLSYSSNENSTYVSAWSEADRISSVEVKEFSREKVKGKFSGIVIDSDGNQKEISEGTFEIYKYKSE